MVARSSIWMTAAKPSRSACVHVQAAHSLLKRQRAYEEFDVESGSCATAAGRRQRRLRGANAGIGNLKILLPMISSGREVDAVINC
jgi:hypothetical protein